MSSKETASRVLRSVRALLVPLVLATGSPARALDVVGNINVDTRWSLADSPVRLTGDVTIAPQATLTVEPGVLVEAAGTDQLGSGTDATRVELVVRGRLLADGSFAAPVIFRPASGSWYGISFESSAGASSLTHFDLSGAFIGVLCRSVPSLALSDFRISSSTTGILWQCASSATLTRAIIERISGNAVDFVGTQNNEQLTIGDSRFESTVFGVVLRTGTRGDVRSTTFLVNDVGIEAQSGSSLALRNSLFVANRDRALKLTQSGASTFDIINNTVDRNMPDPFANPPSGGGGMSISGVSAPASFVVRNNLVTGQGVGIEANPPAQPSLDHNDVWNNASNYVGLAAGVGAISVNPLYVAPYGGAEWVFVAQPASLRNTGNNVNQSWTFTQPGAARIRIVVPFLNTEACCDYLRIYDASGNNVQTLSGSFSGPSVEVNGETIRATYTTDGSVSSQGFDISGYEYRPIAFNYRLAPSSPAIDVGNPLGAPTSDADGTVRPYDGDVDGTAVVDLGAFEWHENIPPFAVAGPDVAVHPSDTVNFDARASRDPDGTIVSYAWDFGDGQTSSDANATHAYPSVGTYTVTLTVTDVEGATGTDSLTVIVTTNLDPVASAGPDQAAGIAEVVTLDGGASTDADGTVVGYSWDFGDGAPIGSGRVVTHAWIAAGVYMVTLTVTDNGGATDTDIAAVVIGGGGNLPPSASAGGSYSASAGAPVTFDGSASSDADGTIASFAWDFGDGATGTGASPTHTYAAAGSYLARLTVTDDGGATDDDVALVTVTASGNAPPAARSGGPYNARVDTQVTFDGSASTDADGTIASYAWEFGDGDSATGAVATHTYEAAGNYLARLVVTDDQGATDEDVAIVTITIEGNVAPTANPGGPYSVKVGVAVNLDGSGSADPDGTIATYAWDFGDSGQGTGAMVSHTYAQAGTYTVRLSVTDDDGAIGQATTVVVVTSDEQPQNVPPDAQAGQDQVVTLGDPTFLNGADSKDTDGTIVTYHWDLGDGSMAETVTVQHTYATAGSFVVKLSVTDDKGAVDEDFVQITVRAAADPGTNPPDRREESGCGCTTTAPSSQSPLLLPVLLAAALGFRRRRGRILARR
ncbi:MAG: PKD domain-containing protein [Deltaproteobacteria bacterium]|nr:PKD domain-containing protein [Deltaproteobacteria bacterium]